jgi:hypothetical protein
VGSSYEVVGRGAEGDRTSPDVAGTLGIDPAPATTIG